MNRILLVAPILLCAAFAARSSGPVGGFDMPSLDDEKRTYQEWGWTWDTSAEPDYPGAGSYVVSDPDIHGDTEGDDLWSYLMAYLRTGEEGYLERATAWADYFKHDYRACVGGNYSSFCYDRDAYGACHLWGWGLVAWYEFCNDTAALAEAEELAAVVDTLWAPDSPFGCLPSGGCTWYGIRQIGRHLLLATRVAEATGNARWVALRDKILDTFMNSGEWDDSLGMYMEGDWSTDQALGDGAFASGDRIVSSFQIGWATEAFAHVYRITGRQDVKDRMIAMARFVERYGVDSTYEYTGSLLGIVDGSMWHNYSATEPVTSWDPVYTTSLVNTLCWGYKLTGEQHFYDRAKHFYNRGTKGIYGSVSRRECADDVCGHFVDSKFSSASGNFYLDYNKGELQYTWCIFESMSSAGNRPDRNPATPCLSMTPGAAGGKIATVFPARAVSVATVHDISGRLVVSLAAQEDGSISWKDPARPAGCYVLCVKAQGTSLNGSFVLK